MKIQNLCTVQGGIISGPLSPMMFAQDMTKQLGIEFSGLCRIWFDDRLLQAKDEDTGFDSVVILSEYNNTIILSMFLDMGVRGLPIAYLEKEENSIDFSPAYREETNLYKPSDETIKEVFDSILNDMSLIKPIEKD